MGRVARKHRIKSFDPYSSTHGRPSAAARASAVERDLAPAGGSDEDERERLPRGLRRIARDGGGMTGIGASCAAGLPLLHGCDRAHVWGVLCSRCRCVAVDGAAWL
jgi:hypothetical protein